MCLANSAGMVYPSPNTRDPSARRTNVAAAASSASNSAINTVPNNVPNSDPPGK